jgi:hypothetical protein
MNKVPFCLGLLAFLVSCRALRSFHGTPVFCILFIDGISLVLLLNRFCFHLASLWFLVDGITQDVDRGRRGCMCRAWGYAHCLVELLAGFVAISVYDARLTTACVHRKTFARAGASLICLYQGEGVAQPRYKIRNTPWFYSKPSLRDDEQEKCLATLSHTRSTQNLPGLRIPSVPNLTDFLPTQREERPRAADLLAHSFFHDNNLTFRVARIHNHPSQWLPLLLL